MRDSCALWLWRWAFEVDALANPRVTKLWMIATFGKPREEESIVNQEKLLGLSKACLYRKPTQVGGCECTKVYERNIVQELGKTAAVTSG